MQYSNPYGSTEFSYGGQPPIPTSKSSIFFFQSKTLRSILNAPWYMNNHKIHEDLQINIVLSEKKVEYKIFR
jgi:hypothetical protein